MQNAKKKIAVFFTGGTISMKKSQSGGVDLQASNPLASSTEKSMDDFLKANNVELIQELVFGEPIPSSQMTEQLMFTLRRAILEKVHSEKVDGVVITHGTDTLEETAFFLDLTVDHSIPIAITGAMRSSDALGADGVYNYQCAIKTAICDEAKGMGTLLVFNGEIHAAGDVTKTHATDLATFKSPDFGAIGAITEKGVVFRRKLNPRKVFNIQGMGKKVILIKAFAGIDTTFFDALEALEEKQAGENKPPAIDGLVIEAFGAGNLPAKLVGCLKKLEERKIPMVLATRCLSGSVQEVYDYAGGGKSLKRELKSLIFSNGLSGVKSRLKLAVLLEGVASPEELEGVWV